MVRNTYQTSRGHVWRQQWTNAVAADPDRLLTATATSDSVATTVTSFLAQPDFPRNITITPGGTTDDVAGDDVVVTGTNIRGETITENITMTENGSTLVAGSKAFATVTSIVFPVQDGAAATFIVGVGDKLGLDRMMDADHVISTTVAGTQETTRPTVAYSNTAIESNTLDPNTALDGAKDVIAYYISIEVTDDNNTTT